MIERQILLVALGGDANPLAEHALEMGGAHAHAFRQLIQRDRPRGLINLCDCTGDDAVMVLGFLLHVVPLGCLEDGRGCILFRPEICGF